MKWLWTVLRKHILHTTRAIAPKTTTGDRAYAWVAFVLAHRRFPTATLSFNDQLYQVRASGSLGTPLRVSTTDKELVKHYVASTIGNEHNVPTLGILHSPAEVVEASFPADCCIKPTHASGKVLFRHSSGPVDLVEIRSWFDLDYYELSRQANYRGLDRKVIIEPILFNTDSIRDYKIFCWHGTPTLIQVDVDRRHNHRRGFFTKNWKEMPFSIGYPGLSSPVERPDNLSAMLKAAARLSTPFEFVRVDFYTDGNALFVGEITHCHGGGIEKFFPKSAEKDASRHFFQNQSALTTD